MHLRKNPPFLLLPVASPGCSPSVAPYCSVSIGPADRAGRPGEKEEEMGIEMKEKMKEEMGREMGIGE